MSQPAKSHPVKRSSQSINERQPLSAVVVELLYTFNRAILRSRCAQNPTLKGHMSSLISGKAITELWKVFHIH